MKLQVPASLATPQQAADYLNVSRAKIFALLRNGRLTRVKLAERTTRVPWAELHKIAGVGHGEA